MEQTHRNTENLTHNGDLANTVKAQSFLIDRFTQKGGTLEGEDEVVHFYVPSFCDSCSKRTQ